MSELTTTDMALLDRVPTGSVSPGRVMNTARSLIESAINDYAAADTVADMNEEERSSASPPRPNTYSPSAAAAPSFST